ncbi:MAG: hypothetical protein AAGE52_11570 [Myxococcota bacterium]
MDYAIRRALNTAVATSVSTLPDAERLRVLREAPNVDLDRLADRWILGWVDMHTHMELCDAIRAVVGSEGNVRFWQRAMRDVITKGFFANLVNTAIRVYGMTPLGYFKMFSRGYEYGTRNLGSMRVVKFAERFADLELSAFPSREFSFDCFVEGLQGTLMVAYETVKVSGEVTITATEEASGIVRYHCAW